ncbi:MAG: Ig-like domain-containing protein [bacterium]
MNLSKIIKYAGLIIGLLMGFQNLSLSANAVALAWDPTTNTVDGSTVSDLAGYKLYCGASSGSYSTVLDVGNTNTFSVADLLQGSTYFFAVTAYTSNSIQSDYSTELVVTVPDTTPPAISVGASLSLNVDAGGLVAIPNLMQNATVTDNCSLPSGISCTQAPAAGTMIGAGITSVILTAIDEAGNSSRATVFVTVLALPNIVLSSPGNGAIFTAPATIPLTATVTANGHSLNRVQFLNGTNLLGETSSPFIYTWSNAVSGTYSLSARLVYEAGTIDSSPVTVVVNALPAPWNTQNIGTGIVSGNASYSNGVFSVSGAGNISGTADKFRFVYQVLSGDGEIKARVSSLQNAGTGAKAGIMIRESLTSGSRQITLSLLASGKIEFLRRTSTGGSVKTTTSTGNVSPNNWVRLVRKGLTITAYKSSNGSTWTSIGNQSISMASTISFGQATASGTTNTLSTATIDNVTVVP